MLDCLRPDAPDAIGHPTPPDKLRVQASIEAPGVRVSIVQYCVDDGCDTLVSSPSGFRLELALSARDPSTCATYPAYWPAGRYERLGEMFVLAPGRRLRIRSQHGAPVDAVVCLLDRELFLDLYREYLGLDSGYPFKEGNAELYLPASLDVQNTKVRSLMVRMADETRSPGLAGKVLIGALAIQLVIELLRVGAAIGAPKRTGGLAAWQLRLIEERLKQLGAAPSLAELAGLCHISVRHLTRAFKESRGCTLGSFVIQSQMDHAKRLLTKGESVGAIACNLEFASTSGFCAAFSRETGLTPAEFRAKFLATAQ